MTSFINYCTNAQLIDYCENGQLIDYCENGQLETALRGFIRERHGQNVIIRIGNVCKLSFPSEDAVRMYFNEAYEGDSTTVIFSGIKRFNRQKVEYLARWFTNYCADVISDEVA